MLVTNKPISQIAMDLFSSSNFQSAMHHCYGRNLRLQPNVAALAATICFVCARVSVCVCLRKEEWIGCMVDRARAAINSLTSSVFTTPRHMGQLPSV